MSPELLDLHRSYADGIIPCDEFAEGLFNITAKGMEWEYGSVDKYNAIMMVLAWYRDECRSVATSFNPTRSTDTMVRYYTRLKEAVDSVVYPNVVH